jgi:hypothetical protein
MKNLSLFTAALLMIIGGVYAQQERYNKNNNVPPQKEESSTNNLDQAVKITDLDDGGGGYNYSYFYGDPCGMYLNKQWQPGHVKVLEGDEMEGLFRYNICVQKIEAIIKGDTFAFARSEEIDYAVIGESKFVFRPYIRANRELSHGWFEKLCDGECALFLRRYIKFRKTDGDDDHSNDQLYRLQEFYVRKAEKPLQRLYMKKDALLEMLSDHEAEIISYMKTNKLKAKREEDLLQILKYYNSLD